jgi:hypothetical protein
VRKAADLNVTKAEYAFLIHCFHAERFTSPTVPVRHSAATCKRLERRRLIHWAPGWRLTEAGEWALVKYQWEHAERLGRAV